LFIQECERNLQGNKGNVNAPILDLLYIGILFGISIGGYIWQGHNRVLSHFIVVPRFAMR
jgi:hypothetical protein